MIALKRCLQNASLIAMLAIAGIGCERGLDEDSNPATSQQPARPLSADVLRIKKVDQTSEIVTYFGSLVPNQEKWLGFPSPGSIETIATLNQQISEGDTLAALNTEDLSNQKSLIQESLLALPAQPSGSPSPEAQRLELQINELDQKIQANQIKAPFNCVVAETRSSVGSLVQAHTPVLRVFEAVNPVVKVNLPRRIAKWMPAGRPMTFSIDETPVQGVVKEKAIEEDPAGSITVWFRLTSSLNNIDWVFGQSVEIRFTIENDKSGFWVPISALNRNANGVWSIKTVAELPVQNSNLRLARVQQQVVGVEQVTARFALLSGDLKNDDLVVADGGHRIVPGVTIQVREIRDQEVPRDPVGAGD